MNVKEYLTQVQDFEEAIVDQKLYIQGLRDSLTAIGCDMSTERVQSSPAGDTIPKIIAEVLEEEDRLKEMEEQTCIFRCQVIRQIHQMSDLQLKEVLTHKYVEWRKFDTLKKVAEHMNYSYDYIKELHAKALLAFGCQFLHSTP